MFFPKREETPAGLPRRSDRWMDGWMDLVCSMRSAKGGWGHGRTAVGELFTGGAAPLCFSIAGKSAMLFLDFFGRFPKIDASKKSKVS